MRLLLAVAASVLAALGDAQAAQHRIPVALDGALEIQMPDGWVADVRGGGAHSSPTVLVTAPGHDFAMTVASVAIPAGAGVPPPARIRAAVERMAAAPEVTLRAEAPVAIQELRGPQTSGYYFTVGDKMWKPGAEEYHYMAQGALVVGNVAINFIFVSNTAPGADLAAGLDVLRSARHAP